MCLSLPSSMFAFSLKMLFRSWKFFFILLLVLFCLKSLPAIHNIKVTSSNDLHQPAAAAAAAVVALRLKRILSLPLQFSLLPSIHFSGMCTSVEWKDLDPIFYTYSFTQFARTEETRKGRRREGRECIKISQNEIKLCRAAGATKTQIHSKVNIQCIIVMCLVVDVSECVCAEFHKGWGRRLNDKKGIFL